MGVIDIQTDSDRHIGGSQNGYFWPDVPTFFMDSPRYNLDNSKSAYRPKLREERDLDIWFGRGERFPLQTWGNQEGTQ